MAVRFLLRRDTAANWTSVNPILQIGEPALETDTRKVKYGDGSTAWNSLPYAASTPPTGAALTKTDDTNVTLTLGGTPAAALLAAVSLALGWTGQLAVARGGTGSATWPGMKTAGQNVIGSSKTLDSADKGTHILLVAGCGTLTFPASGYASGEGAFIVNLTGGNVTLAAPGGADFGTTLPNNASFAAFCDGGGFWRQFFYTTARL